MEELMATRKKASPAKKSEPAAEEGVGDKIAAAVTSDTAKMVVGAIAATAAVAGAVYAAPKLARKAGFLGRKAHAVPSLPDNARTRRKAARMQHRQARRAKAQGASA
jgi:hypothetical protein